ncbi:MAG: RdgB/HAM1 family non-canonical purine NTP pyrophosphatase [Candidatus Brocadiae bacterium]|nr:RdgB/HAM1 family non-canonical purine NTP pyrophosphatase [Candidatus Brocadiia bacterium]
MEKKILVGTNNKHKLEEIKHILSAFPFEIVSLQDIHLSSDVEENGATYLENAFIKAKHFSQASGLPCISDDTGLEIEILQGKPGIHSARWAGVEGEGRYKANNEKLLWELRNIPLEQRKACFRCTIAFVHGQDLVFHCEGICHGRIAFEPRGKNGFGYDPFFQVDGYDKTFAELPDHVKNQISHRAIALQEFQKRFSALSKSQFGV